MFSFEVIQGDRDADLRDIKTLLISQRAAKKYFGDEDPISKVLYRNHDEEYIVKGVFKNPPANTHLQYDFIFSELAYAAIVEDNIYENWAWWDIYFAYIKTAPDTDVKKLEAKLDDFMIKYRGDTWKERGYKLTLSLQPVKDIHFGMENNVAVIDDDSTIKTSDITTFLIVGVFIIVIAWVNSINLSIAQSFLRAKEVGIKKILGSSKWKVVRQFLTESFLVNILATVISFFLLYFLLPLIITALNLEVDIATFLKGELIIGGIGSIVLGVFITGYYPTTILSSFQPIKIIRGKFTASTSGNKWRHALVITQFSCAMFLMICTVGIYQQINHMKSQSLGVNINNKVTFKAPIIRDSLYDDRIKTLLTDLKTNTSIVDFTSSSTVPGMPHEFKIGGVRRQNAGNEDVSHFGLTYIDQNFANVFDLEFVEGENLTEVSEADVEAALINETAVHILGFEDAASAIGERVIIPRGVVTIKGVIKDFHNQSLKYDFEPSIYRLRKEGFKNHHTLSYSPDVKVSEVIQMVQQMWNENYGADPLDLFMVDDNYNNQYTADMNFANLVLLFAIVAIVVTCLGLYSFTSLNLQNQQKDVAIKKVLGANALGLLITFYKKYFKLLLVAGILSCPVAFYFLKDWLNGFAFRMSPGFDLFLIPVSLILIIMIATISGIILKTTRTNPVDVIKGE